MSGPSSIGSGGSPPFNTNNPSPQTGGIFPSPSSSPLCPGMEALRERVNKEWNMNFSPAQFAKFMNSLENMISSQLSAENQQMLTTLRNLGKSENLDEDS